MSPIYGYDFLYLSLRPYVDLCCRRSYRKYIVRGTENIPQDGAVILAPNHCNALMDAITVLCSTREAKVFGARADAFTPLFSKVLRFLKILPMVRKRDGLRNVLKNIGTIETIVEVLENDVKFCIFNEGTHRAMHSLLPIGKGIFRIAIAADERFGDSKPVYVVPIGLEYGDYTRYRSTVIVNYGKPIDISAALRGLSSEQEGVVYQSLRNTLHEKLSELITYIPDNEDYEGKWAIVRLAASGRSLSPEEMLEENRRIAAKIERMTIEEPSVLKKMMDEALEFDAARRSAKISVFSFGKANAGMRITVKVLAAMVLLPYYLFCSAASLPMWLAETFIRKKVKDKAFKNTVSFGIRLALTPLMVVLWSVLYFIFLPWPLAAALLLLSMPSFGFIHDYNEFARILLSDIRLSADKGMRQKYEYIKSTLSSLL